MKPKPLPPLEFLNECFEIDFSCPSGLRWKSRPETHYQHSCNHQKFILSYSGKPVGTIHNGYFIVKLNYPDKSYGYPVHRIVYALINKTTDFNNFLIDHIDQNKLNNSPENLRLVSQLENLQNRPTQSNSKTGVNGVYIKDGRYIASYRINKTRFYLGAFETLEDASLARLNIEKEFSSTLFLNKSREEILEKISNYKSEIYDKKVVLCHKCNVNEKPHSRRMCYDCSPRK